MRLAFATLLLTGYSATADAHCIVGNRFFPATLTVDDPCVADELSMPTVAGFKNGDDPSADEIDIGGEYSKTITPNFGISFEETWIHLDTPGEGSASGFEISARVSNISSSEMPTASLPCRSRSTRIGGAPAQAQSTPSRSPP
jgi:hypothetical protein